MCLAHDTGENNCSDQIINIKMNKDTNRYYALTIFD